MCLLSLYPWVNIKNGPQAVIIQEINSNQVFSIIIPYITYKYTFCLGTSCPFQNDVLCVFVCVCESPQSSQYLLFSPAGDGVLWRRFHHRPGEEHQRQHIKGRLDRLHLPRDPQGQSRLHFS